MKQLTVETKRDLITKAVSILAESKTEGDFYRRLSSEENIFLIRVNDKAYIASDKFKKGLFIENFNGIDKIYMIQLVDKKSILNAL